MMTAAGPATAPAEAQAAGRRRWLAMLVAAGLAMQGLLAGFILLYVNFPAGYNVLYGLSLDSLPLFRTLWAYPVLALEPGAFSALAGLTIVALWGVYLGAVAGLRRWQPAAGRRAVICVIAGFALLYNGVLVLAMPPVLSADLYAHALWGRVVAFYGLNPYVVPGAAIPGDLLAPFAIGGAGTTHFGPVWTLLAAAAAVLGGQSVLLTALALKSIAALFNMVNCLLVFLLARRLTGGDGVAALLLYAWNPLILIETAGSAHKDAVMTTFALLGLLLAVRGRLLLGLAALLLSVLVKYLAALLVLFFVVRCLAKEAAWRRAAIVVGLALIAVLIVAGHYLWPAFFGQVLERLAAYDGTSKTVVRLLLRDVVAGLLASGRDSGQVQATAELYVLWGLRLAFGGLVLLMVKAVASAQAGWSRVWELWGVAGLLYVVFVFSWNYPWYLIPTLTTAFAAAPSRMNRLLAVCAMELGIFLMLPYVWLFAV